MVRALRFTPVLTLAHLVAACGFSDSYFIDPNYESSASGGATVGGSTGGGGASGGRAGKAAEGGMESKGGAGAGTAGAPVGGAPPGSCGGATCTGSCCGNTCVDTATDPAHCGACDAACARGRTCKASQCSSGWLATSQPPAEFVARERSAYVAFGGKMFVFGGLDASGDALNDAAIYDVQSDSWQLVKTGAATPSPRQLAGAFWNGSGIIVFGGRNASGSTYFADGALYEPMKGSWSALKEAPNVRAAPNGGADGKHLIVWGTYTHDGAFASGADRYEFSSNNWQSASNNESPSAVIGAAWGFSGTSLYVYGGFDGSSRNDRAYRYDLGPNKWSQLSRGPAARSGSFGAWDGSSFYVWGGRTEGELLRDGAVFQNGWSALPAGGPSGRYAPPRQHGWSFALGAGDFALLGGVDLAPKTLTDGGRYKKGEGWSSIPTWSSGEEHVYGAAVLVAGEIVIWGGRDGNGVTRTGDRWAPPVVGSPASTTSRSSAR